jgi:hypothetical protein
LDSLQVDFGTKCICFGQLHAERLEAFIIRIIAGENMSGVLECTVSVKQFQPFAFFVMASTPVI